MAEVKCTALHAVSLPDGRLLVPGRKATGIDLADPEIRGHLDSGALIVIEPSTRPAAKRRASNEDTTEDQDR